MPIVENYTAEEELELYRAMLGAQPQSMFLMNQDKIVIGVFNATPEMLAGYSTGDILGSSILRYANDPKSPLRQICSMLNTTFDQVFQSGVPLKYQFQIQGAYFEATITKIAGERILSQVRDVSYIVNKINDIEKKRQNELSIALLTGGLTSWSYDVENDVISSTLANNVISRSMGFNELLSLVDAEDQPNVVKMFDDLIQKRCDHAQVTCRATNKNGEVQWSDVQAVPHLYSDDGRVKLIIGSQKDVTQEHEHHIRLNRLNRQNELILNNSNSGLIYLTPELKVEWENVSTIFSDSEIVGLLTVERLSNVIAGNQGGEVSQVIVNALESRHQAFGKYKMASGVIVELMARPIFDVDGRFDGVVLRVDDVTEKEAFLSELAHAKEKAEQSDRLKSAFLANMSHEIRTPLNSIVGFSQLLSLVDTEEERSEYIQIINSNTQSLLNLINDILDLSKIEAGYFNCFNDVFDLSQLFSELELMFKDKVRPGVSFLCSLPQSSCLVNLDRMRIAQVITNFITNAIKFTSKGHIRIGYRVLDKSVKLFVEDTGCGMSKEQLTRVFERFEKFGSLEQGTGLGTAIAKAIVDAYDGRIGSASELGAGSTFWAILPINMQIESVDELLLEETNLGNAENADLSDSTSEAASLRILIAEDNDSNFKLVEVLLKGIRLERAVNGLEALKMVKATPYDLVFMDIKMPVMDGIEAVLHIREFDPDTPIIALTANAFDDDKQRAYDAGVNGFLTKPMNRKTLLDTVNQYSKKR